ncbi:hypothetical protein EUX98_g7548 [Antrodiella citrinella]|uniref:GP-PDE domain-containing protein n=1 Tax=Antrodiella citrinella TaxID=2447956 RepID=A0A4S4ML90_9APHY|nr:hypothetical protein EUX98_g7548 [Antrodiella citrinella]
MTPGLNGSMRTSAVLISLFTTASPLGTLVSMAMDRLPRARMSLGTFFERSESSVSDDKARIWSWGETTEFNNRQSDDVVLMFHDPWLNRTTNGKGYIKNQPWHGADGMENLRTVKEPKQSIPTFTETVQLLMKPENLHVKFNVDVKVQNDPVRLFSLMHQIISAQPDWETKLAPRILLGMWHPIFLPHAKELLPYCARSYIGFNLWNARRYFWDSVDTFSMSFGSMTTAAGEEFRKEVQAVGKKLMVWTVNEPVCMVEAVRWKVDVILTDVPQTWIDLREALTVDYDKTSAQYGRTFLWSTWRYYPPFQIFIRTLEYQWLHYAKGPFILPDAAAA